MKNIIYIFLVSLFLISCSNIKHNFYLYYYEAISNINDSTLYSHFPIEKDSKIRDRMSVTFPCVNGDTGLEIDILHKRSKKKVNEFINELEGKNLLKYSIKDTCTNYYFKYHSETYYETISKYGECMRNNAPVPHYIYWLSPGNTVFDYDDIKDDLTYYIIEVRSGKFMPDSLLNEQSRPLYDYAYNGCSRGYAVSKNAGLIVYWLIIW
jgi:hypothetical protein